VSEFSERYVRELDERPEVIEALLERCREGVVTLLFAAKHTRYNTSVALKAYLEQLSRRYMRRSRGR